MLCPTNVPPESPESYYSVARRLARDIPGAFQPDQYSNLENPKAHEATTGPEIWRQTDGKVTHVVIAVGTGGTVSGVGHYLKSQNSRIQLIGADPEGSVLSGDTARPYLTEGVGEDFFPGTFDPKMVDRWVRVSDAEAFAVARRVTREEGILVGESSGTALVAARTVVRDLAATDRGAEAVVVVLLPDGGRNYLSKLYNDEWMRINGLLGSPTARVQVASVLRNGHRDEELPRVIVARTTDRVADVIDMLQRYGISQMPVSERDDDAIEGIVGSINERSLLERAYRDPGMVERTVGEVMERPLPTIAAAAGVDEAFQLLSAGAPALVAVEAGRPTGVVTKLDLLEHLAHNARPNG